MEYIDLQNLLFKINIYNIIIIIISVITIILTLRDLFTLISYDDYDKYKIKVIVRLIVAGLLISILKFRLDYLNSVLDVYKYAHPDAALSILNLI